MLPWVVRHIGLYSQIFEYSNFEISFRRSVRRIYRASRSIYSLGPSGLCPAEVRSFISIHQVAPATALLLLLLLLRTCFIVVCQMSLS